MRMSVWQYLSKPFDPAVPFLGIYLKEIIKDVHKDVSVKVLIATFSVVGKLITLGILMH